MVHTIFLVLPFVKIQSNVTTCERVLSYKSQFVQSKSLRNNHVSSTAFYCVLFKEMPYRNALPNLHSVKGCHNFRGNRQVLSTLRCFRIAPSSYWGTKCCALKRRVILIMWKFKCFLGKHFTPYIQDVYSSSIFWPKFLIQWTLNKSSNIIFLRFFRSPPPLHTRV